LLPRRSVAKPDERSDKASKSSGCEQETHLARNASKLLGPARSSVSAWLWATGRRRPSKSFCEELRRSIPGPNFTLSLNEQARGPSGRSAQLSRKILLRFLKLTEISLCHCPLVLTSRCLHSNASSAGASGPIIRALERSSQDWRSRTLPAAVILVSMQATHDHPSRFLQAYSG